MSVDDVLLAGRVLVSLAAVLGAIWLISRKVARRTTGSGDSIRIIGRQGIGAKAQLVVVDIDAARYVLGVTEGAVTVVDRLDAPAPDPVEDTDAHKGSMTTLTPQAPDFARELAAAGKSMTFPARTPFASVLSPDLWRAAARRAFSG
jgi:flagellar protein FliO/FliZ